MDYLERSSTFFYDGRIRNELVSFIPAETVNCKPAYVRGKRDSCWIKYNPAIWNPNFTSQADCERLTGLRLLPLQSA